MSWTAIRETSPSDLKSIVFPQVGQDRSQGTEATGGTGFRFILIHHSYPFILRHDIIPAMMKENLLIIGSSERNPDLYYATRFAAPDPFVFVQIREKKYILISDLEIDRARKQARVHAVLSTTALAGKFREKHKRHASLSDLVIFFLREKKVRHLTVPQDFPYLYALSLKRAGIRLDCHPGIFFKERAIKTPGEIRSVIQALRATENAARAAISLLKKATIRKNRLFYRNTPLTSESIRKLILAVLMEHDCAGENTIVSCGRHSVDPLHIGTGPLFANQPILFDIFPRNNKTLYYADFSRTVVKGKASPKLKKMFAAVKGGQAIAMRMIRPGVSGRAIHNAIQSYFERLGFRTGLQAGRMQGFFHSTGHGLGLEIHEPPRIGGGDDILKEGHLVTVEPGLYYKDAGGIRLEDLVLVTRTGCKNLTQFPKILEI